ncbi:MAG TPA: hybrid sensor histidine kinase/response regulator [Desulfobulbaceae bacterium]|nr:hybrid sensor histidine kinase/response regulator [Desulfobulbaceae bacterium]
MTSEEIERIIHDLEMHQIELEMQNEELLRSNAELHVARKQAEETLQENEQNYRNLADSGQALIWTSGTDNLCNYFNRVWLEFTGRRLEQEMGSGWAEGVHPDDMERCLGIYLGAFDLKEKFSMEYRLRRYDGVYRWILDEGCPRYDRKDQFVGYIGHCLDIHDRKIAAEEKINLQTRLNQAQKMEAIGTLAGGIAHDFNNILASILGYAEMIREDIPSESSTARDLDQVIKASNRAKDLVKHILAFSRLGVTERIPLQPALLVKEIIKLLRATIPMTIAIEHDVDKECSVIIADPTQIHQMLMNLCTNAFHAMEENGGTLSISLNKRTLTLNDLVHEPHLRPGNYVQLSIRDTGTGIKPEIREKIFDPYFTTKETGKGTGMGLSITHGIVKSYGGFITCESKAGEGTSFHINLPSLEEHILPEVHSFEPISAGTERILLVDDDPMLAEMGKQMLERLGYPVTVRMSGIEALNTFKKQPDDFDMVITDQTMLGMTGIDLAGRILDIRPNLPIILCTGYSNRISKELIESVGIKGFALKPFSKNDIAALIRGVLDEGN